jgi:hypothetical protein
MEFHEMQKIWDTQNNTTMYTINEQEMRHIIDRKRNRALHMANASELLLIFVNLGAGVFTLAINSTRSLSLYVMAAWMLCTSLWVLSSRIRRLRGDNHFDRSLIGDLNHAIYVATYQVRFSRLMRLNILPIGGLVMMAMAESEKPVWIAAILVSIFALAFLVGGWEHRMYESRRDELEELTTKLKDNG